MATVPVTNTAAVHVRGTLAGQLTENILYYLFTGSIDEAALAELVTGIAVIVLTDWLAQLSPQWVGREVYGKDLTAGSGVQYTDTTIFGEAGTASGTALPNNDTIAIARKSTLAGRSHRGRIYWQGLTNEMLADVNHMQSSTAAAIVALLTTADDAARALLWTPVIVSTMSGGVPRVTGVTTEISTWSVTDLVLDSRMRRLPGRGT